MKKLIVSAVALALLFWFSQYLGWGPMAGLVMIFLMSLPLIGLYVIVKVIRLAWKS